MYKFFKNIWKGVLLHADNHNFEFASVAYKSKFIYFFKCPLMFQNKKKF